MHSTREEERGSLTRESRNLWYDLIRGAAAVLVCAGHLRAAMFCDFNEILQKSAWQIPFYFGTGLGHQAVLVFFVLSGYFVGGSVIQKRHSFSWANYSLARLSRLWTVLIPALIFTYVVDTGIWFFAPEALQGIYSDKWNSGPMQGEYASGPVVFLCNVFFLQTVICPVYGTNGPLWSLANEFWYYVLFPVFVCAVYPKVRYASIVYASIGIAILFAVPNSMVFAGLIWLLGVLVYYLLDSQILVVVRRNYLGPLVGSALFLIAIANSKYNFVSFGVPRVVSNDVLVGVTFAMLASTLQVSGNSLLKICEWPIRLLSDLSYTLYLFHFPVVIFIASVVNGGQQYQPTAENIALYLGWLFLIVSLSYGAWWLFERNTDFVRRSLHGLRG